MGKNKTIPYSEILLKTERKKFEKLAILYTNVVLYSHYAQRENYKADRRYYKLLKKYKSLKKDNKEFRGLIEDWALVESDEPTRRAMLEAIGSEVKE